MCGIVGIYHYEREHSVSGFHLETMRDTLSHRGPDGAGIEIDSNVGLAHRRLSIIDLSTNASQPFTSNSGRYVIVFNGEIFNYKKLKNDLISQGFSFRTNSDTEVLLAMYERYSDSMLDKLNGMFAFVIYDKQDRTFFAARDRIGIKPFYYAEFKNSFYFASEHKAILAAGVPCDINNDCLDELLLFRYIAGENTVFKYIKRLLPGHTLKLSADGQIKINRWWNHSEKILKNRENLPVDPFGWFEEVFESSVDYRTISDVPIGVMLSGGLDSGCVAAALASKSHKNLKAFTVAFDEEEYNEGHLASKVAEKFGLQYHELKVTGDDLIQNLQRASWLHDEPLVHQNDAQMLALSIYAKKHVSVLLSGEGGDEFMGGYVRYKTLQHPDFIKFGGMLAGWFKAFYNGGIVNRFDKLQRYVQGASTRDLVVLNSSNVYPSDLRILGQSIDMDKFEYRNNMYAEAVSIYPNEPDRQAMYVDLYTHMASVLDRNDRMTMGAGIECRVPFMDYRLMELIPALPSNLLLKGNKGKYLAFNSIAQKLPQEVLNFKKLGFSVPWEQYFKTDKRFSDFKNRLSKQNEHEFFSQINIPVVLSGLEKNDLLSKTLIRQLYMFDLWQKSFQK